MTFVNSFTNLAKTSDRINADIATRATTSVSTPGISFASGGASVDQIATNLAASTSGSAPEVTVASTQKRFSDFKDSPEGKILFAIDGADPEIADA